MKKRLLILALSVILIISMVFFFNKEIIQFKNGIFELKDLTKENEKLKSRIDEYDSLLIEKEYLENENNELKKIADVTNEFQKNFNTIQASVIDRDGSSQTKWANYIIVNKGKNQNVKKDMLVISPSKGLIGKITSVNDNTSTVKLLTNDSKPIQISVTTKEDEKIAGILKGYDLKNRLLIVKVNSDEIKKVKIGATVITSGLGGRYLKGVHIGKVEKVEQGDYGLTLDVYVKPFADFYDIDDVIIFEEK